MIEPGHRLAAPMPYRSGIQGRREACQATFLRQNTGDRTLGPGMKAYRLRCLPASTGPPTEIDTKKNGEGVNLAPKPSNHR